MVDINELARIGNDQFARLDEVDEFSVTSTTVTQGQEWPAAQYSGNMGVPNGQDISPHLAWSGAPEGTKSYAVTIFDPDAPTGSGFWHWSVGNIPADITELAENAGTNDGAALPSLSFQQKNDAGGRGLIGAATHPGHDAHCYIVIVHAMVVEILDIPTDDFYALFGFTRCGNPLGRYTVKEYWIVEYYL